MMGDPNDPFMRNRNAAVQARPKVPNRANVIQAKLIGQSHPTGLTPNLLKLFEPRPPLEHKVPLEKRKCPSYTGMAQFVSNFAEPGNPEYAPPAKKAETSAQRKARIHLLRMENGAKKAAEDLEKYDPSSDPNISGDPYKTLFVARLNYETTESRIKREFETYGPIKKSVWTSLYTLKVRMITDKMNNKPRGYAFIEYGHTRDMKAAYKQADGRKLDNRRVLVDVERGRTVPNWRPRRLGGGLGSTRIGGQEVNMKYSGREPDQPNSAAISRSEEPRAREERQVDREKSHERGRDRDREVDKPRERSYDRTRDREPREERHHRDRDKRDNDRHRDRDRGRDHDRTRDRNRGRDHDRSRDGDVDRDRSRKRPRDRETDHERPRDRETDHEPGEVERDHGRSRDRDFDYDRVESKHGRDRHSHRDRDHDKLEPIIDPYENPQDQGDDDLPDLQDEHKDQRKYNQLEPEEYRYSRGTSESREKDTNRDNDWDYRRSERSYSRDIEN